MVRLGPDGLAGSDLDAAHFGKRGVEVVLLDAILLDGTSIRGVDSLLFNLLRLSLALAGCVVLDFGQV